VTFIDSHARALAAVRLNLKNLGMEGHELILSDAGTDQTGFDLFVGNPPIIRTIRSQDCSSAPRTARCGPAAQACWSSNRRSVWKRRLETSSAPTKRFPAADTASCAASAAADPPRRPSSQTLLS
jgi:hypothetical protein